MLDHADLTGRCMRQICFHQRCSPLSQFLTNEFLSGCIDTSIMWCRCDLMKGHGKILGEMMLAIDPMAKFILVRFAKTDQDNKFIGLNGAIVISVFAPEQWQKLICCAAIEFQSLHGIRAVSGGTDNRKL